MFSSVCLGLLLGACQTSVVRGKQGWGFQANLLDQCWPIELSVMMAVFSTYAVQYNRYYLPVAIEYLKDS